MSTRPISPLLLAQAIQVADQQKGSEESSGATPRTLLPGTPLREGRYRVQELVERQNWPSGAFEAVWMGHDIQQERGVTICEVVIPGSTGSQRYSIMRTAALALASLRHPQIPSLLAAFSDQGYCCFVFERIEGEKLLARLSSLQHPFPEHEVVEFCLQMTDIVGLLAQKNPPVVHGLISPEHVYCLDGTPRYALGNFSILAAAKATPLLIDAGYTHVSPYTAPEFARATLDPRSDLYSILATAYRLVTGRVPIAEGGAIPQARSIQSTISTAFDAILARGLHPTPQQRYQHPAQLLQDLLALRPRVTGARPSVPLPLNMPAPAFPVNAPVPVLSGDAPVRAFPRRDKSSVFVSLSAPMNEPVLMKERTSVVVPSRTMPPNPPNTPSPFLIMPIALEGDEDHPVLPRPEELEPMKLGNDQFVAATLFIVMLLGTALTVILGQIRL